MKKAAANIFDKVKRRLITDLDNKVNTVNDKIDRLTDHLEKSQQENKHLLEAALNEQRLFHSMDGGILRISDTEVATRIFNGYIMYLDPRDISISVNILLQGIWERWVTLAWLSIIGNLKPDAVVLDIGANNGYFGLLAARALDIKKANVILFEPNPHLLYYIRKTLSVNWVNENTTVVPVGVSDKKGTAKLNILKDYVGSSSMHSIKQQDVHLSHKMKIDTEEIVEVQTVRIDDYCQEHGIKMVDLAIMDIEGYEEKAYAGMRKVVAKSPDMILFIEFTKDGYDNPEALYNQMKKDFGHIYTIDTEGNLKVPPDNSYKVVASAVEDYIMLVFSKRNLVK